MEQLQEQKLRAFIRQGIIKKKRERLEESISKVRNNFRLRSIIQNMLLKEASDVTTDTPSRSTGINVLATVLKLVIPILKQGYEQLTTSLEQKISYRAHIVQNAINILMRVDLTSGEDEEPRLGDEEHEVVAPEPGLEGEPFPGEAEEEFPEIEIEEEEGVEVVTEDMFIEQETEEEEGEEDIDIEIEVGDEDKDKFIDIEDTGEVVEPEPPPVDAAGVAKKVAAEKEFIRIDKLDKTGMEMAQRQFPKIAKQIADGYAMLSLKSDKEDFADFLIANLKMYFDQFDQEVDASLQEPVSPEYQAVAGTTEKFAGGEEAGFEEEAPAPMAESMKVLKVLRKLLPAHEYFKRTP